MLARRAEVIENIGDRTRNMEHDAVAMAQKSREFCLRACIYNDHQVHSNAEDEAPFPSIWIRIRVWIIAVTVG